MVKTETSKGSVAFDQETPSKRDKIGVPKAKEEDDGGAKETLSEWAAKKGRGSAAWAFCFLTPVRGSFSFVDNRRELWSHGGEAKATLCFSRVGTARRFCQVHVRAGTVRSPASAGFTRFWSLANGPCCYGTTC